MEIKIDSKSGSKEGKKLGKFLSAIVVNKALFWTIHLKTNLERMRALGLSFWAESQKIPLSPAWAKRKAKLNGYSKEVNIATGQTKEQALFLTGDLDVHMTGRGNVLSNINAGPWVPNPALGSPPWHYHNWSDRPFYFLSVLKGRNFWRGVETYPELDKSSMEIWSGSLPNEATIEEASKLLIMSPAKCNSLLNGKLITLGSWISGANKGAASKWR